MKRLLTTGLAFALTGCSAMLDVTDKYGNEARPFGVIEERPPYNKMVEREVESRSELIVACQDMKADDADVFISRDGLNCVKLYSGVPLNSEKRSCEVLKVKDKQQDTGWVYAICNRGWRPFNT